MDLNGEKDGLPIKMPVALIDILAGHQLKEGLLLAMLKRERAGEGSFVEVNLIQTAIASLANQATNWLVGKHLPVRQGSAHPNIAPYGDSFTTRDGKRILLAVGSDRQFEELMKIMGIEDWAIEFKTNQQRISKREELNKVLKGRIAQMDSAELIQSLNSKKIPAGFIQNLKEVFELPQAKGILIEQTGLKGVKTFIAKDAEAWQDSGMLPPPHLGEHTEEVIRQMENPV